MIETMPLSQFVEINPKIKLIKGTEYPFVEMNIVTPGCRYISSVHKRNYNGGGAKFRAGDTLFARITPCLENGKIAQFFGKNGEIGFGSTEFFVFRYKEGISDPGYVFYLANSDIVRKPAEKSMFGASGRQRADLASIKDLEIPAPPLHTQRKIAAILSAYDDLIENNTQRIKILEEMAQALYREWFVKFRFPGHEKVKMVESELGMVPEGWEVKKLKDICSLINYGYTASAQKDSIGPKFLRITDIVPYLIDWDSVPYCGITEEKLIKYKLEEGDIVIARTGATTGYAKRINKNHPETVFASYLVRIRISPEFSNRLFGLIIESEEYKNFIKSNLGGAAQPQANAQILTSKPILVPSKGIQISFDKIISDFMDNRGVLQKKNINLRRTRDLLLPKLISGEVDVQDLKIINGVSNGRY